MRIATYNVEWFDTLFEDDGTLSDNNEWSSRRDVTRREQIAALGEVFQTMDADAVMVIEAPDTSRRRSGTVALENFAARFDLRARKALIGFPNDTQQEIILLYDPDVMSARHAPMGEDTGKKGSGQAPRFDAVFRIDLDIDATADVVRFSKPPLEVAVKTASSEFRMIGVHAKSKAPYGAKTPDEIMQLSIANRRKQLAQCIWIRQRVDELLALGEPLIVLGDFNDGPGLDQYEKLFGRGGVEIVLGGPEDTPLYDPHARIALNRRIAAVPATSRFYIPDQGRYLQALLDYVMVSPDLRERGASWRIWHPFEDAECYGRPSLRDALLKASDHFPVTLDIDL